MSLRRFGYHGLYHEAACRHAARATRLDARTGAPCVASICLEARAEVACAVGGRALTVTGGATPLEGLPGETTCGEIDPGIVLQLSRQPGWGPDRIAEVLSRQSGLMGLAGRHVTLRDLFPARDEGCRLAREVFTYRLLQACGAGLAAMGRIDTIVFSGRHADLGRTIGPWLQSRLTFRKALQPAAIGLEILPDPLERIAADLAVATAATPAVDPHRTPVSAGPIAAD
jgi:acetate kinase